MTIANLKKVCFVLKTSAVPRKTEGVMVNVDYDNRNQNQSNVELPVTVSNEVQKPPENERRRGQVFVTHLDGRTLTFDVILDDDVEHLQRQIQVREGLLPEQQHLRHGGQRIESGRTLASYGIERESTLHMVLSLRGC